MEPSTEILRRDTVTLFALTTAGVIVFGLIHLFEYVGDLAVEMGFGEGNHDHAHDHLDDIAAIVDNSSFLWMFVVFYGLAIIVPLLAAVTRGGPAAWSVFALGTLVVVASVGDGINHALADGVVHPLVTAVIAVGVPGVFACRSAFRWARQSSIEPAKAAASISQ